jgi:hypothetical protein
MVNTETSPEKCSNKMPSLQDHKKTCPPFNPLEGCAWPDSDPSLEGGLFLDNVSQMNATPIEQLWFPRCEQDMVQILQSPWDHNKCISIRGMQHSMGGHSLCPDRYVVDTKYLNHMQYNPITKPLTCQVGCMWANIIPYLDQYLKSPKVLQSYCTFSVSGTLAVNVHDNLRMDTGYGRYGATYSMVALSCFNDKLLCVWVELSLLPKNPTEANLQATSTRGETTEPTKGVLYNYYLMQYCCILFYQLVCREGCNLNQREKVSKSMDSSSIGNR